MAFMKPQVYFGQYYSVDADHGATYIVPVDVSGIVEKAEELQDYVEGKIDNPDAEVDTHKGWLCRLSAPGYLDCTDWSAFPTEQEAREYLTEAYGDDEEDTEEV